MINKLTADKTRRLLANPRREVRKHWVPQWKKQHVPFNEHGTESCVILLVGAWSYTHKAEHFTLTELRNSSLVLWRNPATHPKGDRGKYRRRFHRKVHLDTDCKLWRLSSFNTIKFAFKTFYFQSPNLGALI